MTTRGYRRRAAMLAILWAAGLGGCVYDPYTGYVYPCDAYYGCYYPSYYYYHPSYYNAPHYAPPSRGWVSPPAAEGAATAPVTQHALPSPPPSGYEEPSP